MRVVAVDWSGSVAARGSTTRVAGGEPVFLECGRTTEPLADIQPAPHEVERLDGGTWLPRAA